MIVKCPKCGTPHPDWSYINKCECGATFIFNGEETKVYPYHFDIWKAVKAKIDK